MPKKTIIPKKTPMPEQPAEERIHNYNEVPYGYAEELPVERYFRDAKVGTIWEGTSEIQQQIICRELGMYESS